MAEATQKTTRSTRSVTQTSSPADKTATVPEVRSEQGVEVDPQLNHVLANISSEDIRAFVDFRRAALKFPRLGGRPSGSAQMAASAEIVVLNVFERFADWIDEGKPGPKGSLTDEQAAAYQTLRDAGLPLPPEVQL